jgi:hypothetical protein
MITTTEHLQLIKAECERLLAIAEKRTQGEWERDGYRVFQNGNEEPLCCLGICNTDGDYIAACAGRAEAGWRATIAAIDNLELIHEQTDMGEYAAWDAMQDILAAWPLQILTNKPQ